jgi:hypothetical protein
MMTSYEQRAYDALAMKLTEAGYSYQNTSWDNDATASISVTCARLVGEEVQEFEFQIYIPNCDYWDPDNECFNTYAITDETTGHTYDFDRADEVVEHIQEITGDLARPWHTN